MVQFSDGYLRHLCNRVRWELIYDGKISIYFLWYLLYKHHTRRAVDMLTIIDAKNKI